MYKSDVLIGYDSCSRASKNHILLNYLMVILKIKSHLKDKRMI